MIYLTITITSFCAVFLKSIAQQNVQYRRKGLILPTSMLLAVCEMLTTGLFVTNLFDASFKSSVMLVLCIGVGGGCGSLCSLDFHFWLTKKIYKHKG